MAKQINIAEILKGYDKSKIRIGTLGGHSALDICFGAKAEGYETVVVAQKGRDQTYAKHYKTNGDKGCVDHVILVDKFADIVKSEVQEQLRKLNVIFINSRYFWVYCNPDEIENEFNVPVFGNRVLVRKEERNEPKNQYFLLKEAGVRIPKQFAKPKSIDRLAIVKTPEASRKYERAFFLVSSQPEYLQKSTELIENGVITQAGLDKAVIEEFVLGPQVNLNFFYSPLADRLELMGTDMRRQTNIDGLLRLTAPEQAEVLKHQGPKYIENGHVAVTLKESLLEQVFTAGENFIKAVKKHQPPGMVGPFALQGAFTAGPPKEELVVFDVSMRIPGSPGTMFTPYSGYLHGKNISMGQRIAQEIKQALDKKALGELLT